MTREEKVFAVVQKGGIGLEIGPSHNPFAPKKKGYNVHIVDHASRQELVNKYQGHRVNLENIEEVDFIWSGEKLSELIGQKACYDWIIASHVIEHTTDLITFLQECAILLKDTGVLSLVIPDKRYCFDYYRWPSSTGEVFQAHIEQRIRHQPGTVVDHYLNAAKMGDAIGWSKFVTSRKSFVHTLETAQHYFESAQNSSEYIDVHNWRFTPSSFRILLHDMVNFGFTDLGEIAAFDTEGLEFYISLGKPAAWKLKTYDRFQLAQAMMREIKDDKASIFDPRRITSKLIRMPWLVKIAKKILRR